MSHCSNLARTFRICLTTSFICVAFVSTEAIVDLNSDGLDDIWQLIYGAPGLTLNGNADNDGQGDLVWQNTVTGARYLWLMRGTSLAAGVNLGTVPTTWNVAGFGDFNGDGNTDIVWQNKVTGTRVIWLMNGTQISSIPNLGVVSAQWSIAAVGDFDHDGKPDLLWQNNVTGASTIWLMDGITHRANANLPLLPASWKVAGAGDFDGDGNMDILWQNNLTGARALWLMKGTTVSHALTVAVFSTQWNIVGVGDFNGDGGPDIVLQNDTTKQRQVWLMNGVTRVSSVNLANASAPWQVAGVGNFSGDGISNLQESLAGTDPFNARSGLRITQTVFGSGTVTLHWPSILGKQYQVLASNNGAQGSWQPVGGAFAGTGAELVATLSVTAAQKFFRIAVSDLDSDGDGLSDWEEVKLGLNPNLASSDGVNNDYQRVVAALQAATSTLTITENDPVWSSSGVTPGNFTINRSGRLDALTIGISLGGDAVSGADYQSIPNSVSLPFGASSVKVNIVPLSGAVRSLTLSVSPGSKYQSGTPASAMMSIASPQSNAADVARLLTQSTFGPTPSLLTHVQLVGLGAFLDEQFNTAATLTLPRVDQAIAALPMDTGPSYPLFQEAWWHTVVTAPDQLRQRVAFALSEIFVTSANGNDMHEHPEGMATYWDLLAKDAFGNFRQLLEDVTLNPVMGDYLDMAHNDKPNPDNNTQPNENYAREVMQLFTVGLYRLNQDGTRMLDSQNQPIPAYDQDEVEGLAHVFTGWYWAQSGTPHWYYAPSNYRLPMQAFADHHDKGAKELIGNITLPSNQSQDKDLKDALDLLFNHPNTGPFVCRQLIQRLVTEQSEFVIHIPRSSSLR